MSKKYDQTITIVQNNNMAYDQIQNNLDITIDSLSTEEIINFVKNQAKSNNIRFGSIESAAYHMIIHSVDPIESYISKANQFVANDNISTSIMSIKNIYMSSNI